MKILFLSNYFNHHQAPLSDALWRLTDGDYCFVETGEMSPERQALGYTVSKAPYVLKFSGNESRVLQAIREADLVIAGSAPENLIRQRIRARKLLFRYSERPLRKGPEPVKYLPRLLRWHWQNPAGKPVYLLCASAYAAGDYARFGLFRNRAFRWGYFPETRRYADISRLINGKDPTEILWCGRFLTWKHPADALRAARILKEGGCCFQLTFIGTGEGEGQLRRMTREYDLEKCVRFLGPMPHGRVRDYMEKTGIFLFTSDQQEGWGAVLNEAMNSGCAVIASRAAGATPFLVRHGENGLIYEAGNAAMLAEHLRRLLDHPEEQRALGLAAYETITDIWNAETAAARLVTLAQRLLAGEKLTDYPSGPCSRANEIKDDAKLWKT